MNRDGSDDYLLFFIQHDPAWRVRRHRQIYHLEGGTGEPVRANKTLEG